MARNGRSNSTRKRRGLRKTKRRQQSRRQKIRGGFSCNYTDPDARQDVKDFIDKLVEEIPDIKEQKYRKDIIIGKMKKDPKVEKYLIPDEVFEKFYKCLKRGIATKPVVKKGPLSIREVKEKQHDDDDDEDDEDDDDVMYASYDVKIDQSQ